MLPHLQQQLIKQRHDRPVGLNGADPAKITAIACSEPPKRIYKVEPTLISR
jgi:hypothetical protein